jgi:nucleotide-binding universal stress UspA family protein
MMKVLVATDGSHTSDVALESVSTRPWPTGTAFEVVSVVHAPIPLVPEPTLLLAGVHHEALERERGRCAERLEEAAARLRRSGTAAVATRLLEGDPKEAIVTEAERWGADLIVVGSHGHGAVRRFLLGSVSLAVALHAPCSVEIVRPRARRAAPA